MNASGGRAGHCVDLLADRELKRHWLLMGARAALADQITSGERL
jgi:hypothetical protein